MKNSSRGARGLSVKRSVIPRACAVPSRYVPRDETLVTHSADRAVPP